MQPFSTDFQTASIPRVIRGRTAGFRLFVGACWLAAHLLTGATVAAAARAQPVDLPPLPANPQRIARLRAHGLEPTSAVLVPFLEHGFPAGTRLADLPSTPPLKTQIVIEAIIESGRQRMALSGPTLARLARGSLPEAIRAIVDWDLQQQRASGRKAFEAEVIWALRHNAIVALGLIGDPACGYMLVPIFEDEKDPRLKIACALALATLGSRSGLAYLVHEVGRRNRTTSVEAAEALHLITGLDYGPGADDPVAVRAAAAGQWKKWWRRGAKTFRPDPRVILARRMTPPIAPIAREPRTIRDLVDRITYPTDSRWTIDAYDAFERLRLMGREAFDGLEKIVPDRNENLRVRQQAILLYTKMATAASGQRSDRTNLARRAYNKLRWLRWFDRNPEIRETVRQCLPPLRRAR